MKVCSKCKVEKDESEFYKDKKSKDGFTYLCKTCNNNRSSEYILKNKDSVNKMKRAWKLKNIEKVRVYAKKYSIDNPEKKRKTRLSDIEKLNDCYVRSQLIKNGFSKDFITDDLLKYKRIHIQINRIIKEKKQCAT